MNYQPFLDMHILVSDALLATVPAFFQIVIVCIAAFLGFRALCVWLNSDI